MSQLCNYVCFHRRSKAHQSLCLLLCTVMPSLNKFSYLILSYREVCETYKKGQMPHRTVCRWVAKFSAGQQQLKETARPGRPATTTTKGNIKKIEISSKLILYTP